MPNEGTTPDVREEKKVPHCGIIMPISKIEDCDEHHWRDVKQIIEEAVGTIESPAFSVGLVSEALDIGAITRRIVENVYLNDVIVCDISCKNPNVMFELGMRIAFDKNVVIIKDDRTERAFDIADIESIPYPRSLRFPEMVAFKADLAKKVLGTYNASLKPSYQSILRTFGAFEIAKVEEKEVSEQALLLRDVQRDLSSLVRSQEKILSQLAEFEIQPASINQRGYASYIESLYGLNEKLLNASSVRDKTQRESVSVLLKALRDKRTADEA